MKPALHDIWLLAFLALLAGIMYTAWWYSWWWVWVPLMGYLIWVLGRSAWALYRDRKKR
jgi:CHASE2 domain-containing sensor protein